MQRMFVLKFFYTVQRETTSVFIKIGLGVVSLLKNHVLDINNFFSISFLETRKKFGY
jgi:hypothetical protein